MAVALLLSTATWAYAPDGTLRARQNASLNELGAKLVELRDYSRLGAANVTPTEKATLCGAIGRDAMSLVAQLELNRRKLPGGLSPADAAPLARHIADAYLAYVGIQGSTGVCSWLNLGFPTIMHAPECLGYALHRYGGGWPQAVKEAIRASVRDAHHDGGYYDWMTNAWINIVAGDLLTGEALGDKQLFDRGMWRLNRMYQTTRARGSVEMNSPIYTGIQLPALVFMQALKDPKANAMARILFEYNLLLNGHMYLPGNGLSAPQHRDYAGGAEDVTSGLHRILWLLAGDESVTFPSGGVSAATDYVMPDVLRSIFLDKGEQGFEFGTNQAGLVPATSYPLGTNGAQVAPWHVSVLPGGAGSLGAAYGTILQPLFVSMGAYLRSPNGGFGILYHHAPLVAGDTWDSGNRIGGSGLNSNPDDFVSELYDFERLLHGRTLIQLFDPTLRDKASDVVRTARDTRASLPNFAALGGRELRQGNWRVGELGDGYLAFLPLGTIAEEKPRANGNAVYLRFAQGFSGSIVEIASKKDFATLEAFAADLATRNVQFDATDRWAAVDARTLDGKKVRIRLDYRPERRIIGGVERTPAEVFDFGVMHSSIARFDHQNEVLTVQRGCFEGIAYDWKNVTVTVLPPPASCQAPQTTVFSDVPYVGDFANWSAKTPSRWRVVPEGTDQRLQLTIDSEAVGDPLLEVALLKDRTYDDFVIDLRAWTLESLSTNPDADYAVVFSYQDPDDYAYLLANSNSAGTKLMVLENGVNREVATLLRALIPDDGGHRVRLQKEGTVLNVWLDDEHVLTASDPKFVTGPVGLGAYDDSVQFDDVAISAPATTEPPPHEDDDLTGASPTAEEPPQAEEDAAAATRGCSAAPASLGWLLFIVISGAWLRRVR